MKDASASDLWLQAGGKISGNSSQRSPVRRAAVVVCCALVPALAFLLLASTSFIDRVYYWTIELKGWRTVELICVLAATLCVIATLHWWDGIAGLLGARDEAVPEVDRDRLLNVVADVMDDVLTLSTVDGRVLYVSPSAARFVGHRGGEVLHAGLLTRVHEDDHAGVMDAHRQCVMGDVTRVEWRMRMPDGEYVWCETVSVPVRNRNGAVELIAGCTRNIATRKRAEADAMLAATFLEGVQQEYRESIEPCPTDALRPLLVDAELDMGLQFEPVAGNS